jgi:Ca-activated chloride channel homolog
MKLFKAIACALLIVLTFGLSLKYTSAQDPAPTAQPTQQPPQDTTRSRRATDSQQNQESKPTAPKDDDLVVNDDDVVRVETDLTNILFTATDKNRRFVTTIKQEDIKVLEDGVKQELFSFQRQTDLPLSLAILIDTSASQERTLPDEKAAASAFLSSVVRPSKDEVAIISFTGISTLEQGLTGNVQRLRRALDRVEFVKPSGYIGGGVVVGTPPISGDNQALAGTTAIWDAVWVTADEVLAQAPERTRRAIILLTDGEDTSSTKKMSEAIDRAVKSDVIIYGIGIGDRYEFNIDEGAIKKVSERTGGRAFFPRDESSLREAFEQIQLELRSQYSVAYSPTNKKRDGSFRKVQIEVVNPELRKQNLKLTYRDGYFAKTK